MRTNPHVKLILKLKGKSCKIKAEQSESVQSEGMVYYEERKLICLRRTCSDILSASVTSNRLIYMENKCLFNKIDNCD